MACALCVMHCAMYLHWSQSDIRLVAFTTQRLYRLIITRRFTVSMIVTFLPISSVVHRPSASRARCVVELALVPLPFSPRLKPVVIMVCICLRCLIMILCS
jgi:hypothetical protein